MFALLYACWTYSARQGLLCHTNRLPYFTSLLIFGSTQTISFIIWACSLVNYHRPKLPRRKLQPRITCLHGVIASSRMAAGVQLCLICARTACGASQRVFCSSILSSICLYIPFPPVDRDFQTHRSIALFSLRGFQIIDLCRITSCNPNRDAREHMSSRSPRCSEKRTIYR